MGCGPCADKALFLIGEPIYDPVHSYNAGEYVVVDGVLYVSLQDGNEGNAPSESDAWWVRTTILEQLVDNSENSTGTGLLVRRTNPTFLLGFTVDAPLAELRVTGEGTLYSNTALGEDTKYFGIYGGGREGASRSGYIEVFGNDHPTLPGHVIIEAGNAAGSKLILKRGGVTILTVNETGNIIIPGNVQIDGNAVANTLLRAGFSIGNPTLDADVDRVKIARKLELEVDSDGGTGDGVLTGAPFPATGASPVWIDVTFNGQPGTMPWWPK